MLVASDLISIPENQVKKLQSLWLQLFHSSTSELMWFIHTGLAVCMRWDKTQQLTSAEMGGRSRKNCEIKLQLVDNTDALYGFPRNVIKGCGCKIKSASTVHVANYEMGAPGRHANVSASTRPHLKKRELQQQVPTMYIFYSRPYLFLVAMLLLF